jgi:hypothetical protein
MATNSLTGAVSISARGPLIGWVGYDAAHRCIGQAFRLQEVHAFGDVEQWLARRARELGTSTLMVTAAAVANERDDG